MLYQLSYIGKTIRTYNTIGGCFWQRSEGAYAFCEEPYVCYSYGNHRVDADAEIRNRQIETRHEEVGWRESNERERIASQERIKREEPKSRMEIEKARAETQAQREETKAAQHAEREKRRFDLQKTREQERARLRLKNEEIKLIRDLAKAKTGEQEERIRRALNELRTAMGVHSGQSAEEKAEKIICSTKNF